MLNLTSDCSHICDMCHAIQYAFYCRTNSAYLCANCGVWVCTLCGNAPADFTYKSDVTSLCSACDAEIRSANLLAARHISVPVEPICGFLSDFENANTIEKCENETDSWWLFNPANNDQQTKSGYSCDSGYDNFPVLGGASVQQQNLYSFPVIGGASVQQQNLNWEMENEILEAGFHQNPSTSCGISVPFMDAGITPPESTISSISNSCSRRLSQGTFGILPQFYDPIDREAKVQRYREKRKARKYHKRIRYTSRKAHAETRPRMKGRFC